MDGLTLCGIKVLSVCVLCHIWMVSVNEIREPVIRCYTYTVLFCFVFLD